MALKGVLSAIVTPFTPDGEQIDEAALRNLIDWNIADGIDGFVPAGGTGEFSVLSHQERLRLVEIVVEQTAGRATVLAHTGATSSREAIAFSRHAEKVGATAIMLATPYYEPIGYREAFAYYAAVADATSLPICAYNFPPATGLHLDVDFLVKLATEIPQVTFVKDSSANIAQMNTLLSDYSDRIGFLNGEDVLMLPALMMKAPGMVMGVANFMAPALIKAQTAMEAGDDATAVAIWRQINPVVRILGNASYNSGIKAACELLGLPVGKVRAPIQPYSEDQTAALKAALQLLDPSFLTAASR
ncbi:dihydrodipicolinate synthase family protein [Ancylobacter amanitiformis]|uniref:4-hydroxy-tetrahydrodipicolinate synthase n=1 Tax=Ancylobacter amanitiformis TaxID=217069 RepID=A0ABU0LXI1_9HYPH|nr:dihydrodipicolinate synthase family protein [Ancylobacter amanitiformis]MDQ0513389.1 4-hydroxy-tetrahydrodipicolinate synthase [Ancylobacter amanitiformis]